ncbi:MAG: D-alanyl-D-alanine carboxypeptidase/D-alanyl-D-alanine-endopeptidase [Chitinophagaceae bacterium]|nr:MAG: D-alanyl-D-alanine carboxypeptidase/D-alanyl-D-alanine-endopeptidase [Chitinophagaceae bacterium]
MKQILLATALLASTVSVAQGVESRLKQAWERFEGDSQLRAGIASIYVADAQTGAVVFERNSRIGLAPASSQKVITAASAYSLLGTNFRYVTELACDSALYAGSSNGDLYLIGNGDPTLGSWRWTSTRPDSVLKRFVAAAVKRIKGTYRDLVLPQRNWNTEVIPPGWIWEDLGQYYGAGAQVLNWHENQFDLKLRSGTHIGDSVVAIATVPKLADSIAVLVRSAAPGTGDQTYFYPANNGLPLTLRGTIPINQPGFIVSGSLPDPQLSLAAAFTQALREAGARSKGGIRRDSKSFKVTVLERYQSPPLDSIVFWFMRKSINLFGEALIKTIAAGSDTTQEVNGIKLEAAETSKGASRIRGFWRQNGIDPAELRLRDGSGLSPENRVTTRAQVQVLQYARKQSWFPGFYLALPEYNGMKLKSGTIGGVKAYCGYHTSKAGVTYTVSFLVNNYNGSEREIVQKMYAVLNELK